MPTYAYGCKVCGNEFEIEQSIKESPLAECPKCRVCTDNRLIVGTSFVLKGDGWAKDLYAKAKP
jgi:putative FmdB family regulatory protein